jgi:hypothetical protein
VAYREPVAPAKDPDRELVLAAVQRTQDKFGGGLALAAGLAVITVVGGVAREMLWLSALGGAFFASVAALMVYARRRTRRSPALFALLERPEDVVSVTHYTTSDSRGLFVSHWLRVRTAGGQVPLRIDAGDVSVAQALARRCPRASIDVPGFTRAPKLASEAEEPG